jgi:hypothetical protein
VVDDLRYGRWEKLVWNIPFNGLSAALNQTTDVLVGSPRLAQLQAVATGGSGFSATPFYSRIAQVYSEGAGIVVAADLEQVIAHTRGIRRIGMGENREQALNQLGIFNVTSFVLDSKDTDGKTHTRAVLSYNAADHGVTSWLARRRRWPARIHLARCEYRRRLCGEEFRGGRG